MGWAEVSVIVATIVAAMASWTDLSARRIPNRLTYAALLVALALAMFEALATGSVAPFGAALAGLAVCAAPFLVAFLVGGCGGGDVKLMAALGALAGWPLALELLVWVLLAGAVIAIGLILSRGQMLFYLRRAYLSIGQPGAMVRPSGSAATQPGLAIPFAVAALAGTLVVTAMRLGGYPPVWWPA